MKRLLLISATAVVAGGIAATPAVAGLVGNASFSHHIPVRVPTQAKPVHLVDSTVTVTPANDRHRGSATPTVAVTPSATPTPDQRHGSTSPEPGEDRTSTSPEPGEDRTSTSPEPGEDRGSTTPEPGDDRGSTSPEPGDDRGSSTPEPGDDHGSATSTPGDDSGRHGGGHGSDG
jgi:hypothetical protein